MRHLARAAALLAALAVPASGYIEVLYPLQQFIAESEVIATGEIEKVDPNNKVVVIKVAKSLKGKCAYPKFRLNVGTGHDWHPQAAMRHLVVGAPAVVLYNAERRAEVYVNRFFFQFFGDPAAAPDQAWWTFNHIEIKCNRTFCGTAEELAKTVTNVLSGKRKAPPPNPKLPPVTRDDLAAIPVWGQPGEEEKLPVSIIGKKPGKPRDPENPPNVVGGLDYRYYEGAWTEVPDFEKLTPAASGACEVFDLSRCKRRDQLALRFTGFVDAPRDGTYTFYTNSDDGSRLFIGKEEVVNNDGVHGPQEIAGDVALKKGKHALTVVYFQKADGQKLEVLWEGPELPKQPLPAAALFRTP